jgi:hypothetical protein
MSGMKQERPYLLGGLLGVRRRERGGGVHEQHAQPHLLQYFRIPWTRRIVMASAGMPPQS